MINIKKEFQVKEGLKLVVDSTNFDIRVHRGESGRADVVYQFAIDAKHTDPVEELFSLNYDEADNTLKIQEKRLKGVLQISEAKMEIGIPGTSDILIKNENGMLSLKEIDGHIDIKNENGQLAIKDCKGILLVDNGNGSVKVKRFSGKLEAKTLNGSFKATGGSGALKVRSSNGRIKIQDTSYQELDLISSNSSIHCQIPSLNKGTFRLRNVNGKINLLIPKDLSFKLQAKNENGSFHIGLEDNYETEKIGHSRSISMVRGVGKVNIELENHNGSINILKDTQPIISFKFQHFPEVNNMSEAMEKIFSEFDNFPDSKLKDKLRLKILKNMDKMNFDPEKFVAKMQKKFGNGFLSGFNDIPDREPDEDDVPDENDFPNEDVIPDEKDFPVSGSGENREMNEENMEEELQQKVLKMVEAGTITTEEAEKLIQTIKGD